MPVEPIKTILEDMGCTIFVRVQRDSNPRPAAPQAAILSKLNYGPPATDNFSIYELPFATQQRLRATPLHKV
jgi:hypothetical protein